MHHAFESLSNYLSKKQSSIIIHISDNNVCIGTAVVQFQTEDDEKYFNNTVDPKFINQL
jgi:hypothetical protein